jgi:hypothetical protein
MSCPRRLSCHSYLKTDLLAMSGEASAQEEKRIATLERVGLPGNETVLVGAFSGTDGSSPIESRVQTKR